jgi:hypothetical protein
MKTKARDFISPLATEDQAEAERRAMTIAVTDEVLSARQPARTLMTEHPLAKLSEARARIDRALDKWLYQLILQTIGSDLSHPRFIWSTNLARYRWFGHEFPGSGAAIDCPDNIYRNAGLDGGIRYEVTGKVNEPRPSQFTFQLTRHPKGDGFAVNDDSMRDLGALQMLTSREMDIADDGHFRITLDNSDADGRRNHIRMPEGELYLLVRDSLGDWRQIPNDLEIRRVGGSALPPPLSDADIASRVAGYLPGFVDFWLRFNDNFNGRPDINTLVPPYGRTGAWGYAATCHFRLRDDQAIVATVVDGGADYFGVQMADTWMIAPSPTEHISSYNKTQALANPDGTFTFILAPRDPGLANWIDTAGLHEGWLFFRWQGMPAGAPDPEKLLRNFQVVDSSEIEKVVPETLPAISAQQRRDEVAGRAQHWSLRVATP